MKKKVKKIAALIMCGVLAVNTAGCGNTASDKEIKELKKEIAQLKEENEELEAKNKELRKIVKVTESTDDTRVDYDNTAVVADVSDVVSDVVSEAAENLFSAANEQETWSDDKVIAFTDPEMVKYIRKITGIEGRDITYGDVKDITEFVDSGSHYSNIAPLQYFTSLKRLDIGTITDTDINALANLKYLEEVHIKGDNIKDISAIENLNNLETLYLEINITDLDVSPLFEQKSIKKLEIYSDTSDWDYANNIELELKEKSTIEDIRVECTVAVAYE